MPATTPVYAFRYQELGDAPHGPNLGQNLATDVENLLVSRSQSAKVRRASATGQVLTNNASTAIAWDTIVKDSGGMVPVVANGIKVLATDEYTLEGQIAVNTTSMTTCHIVVRVNGVDRQVVFRRNPDVTNAPLVMGFSIGEFALVADDVVTVALFHISGADRTTFDGSGIYKTELAIRRLL